MSLILRGMSPLPKRAMNAPTWGRFTNAQPFINLIHSDLGEWSESNGNAASPSYTDSRGWLSGLPNNTSRYKHPLISIYSPFGVVRLGRYFCTWTGPANLFSFQTDASVNGGNVVINDNKCAVDVTAIAASGGGSAAFYVSLRCNNQTGSALNFDHTGNLAVYHEDDEADFLAGKIFQQTFLDTMDGCSVIRFMDWLQTNESIGWDFVEGSTCTSGTNSTTINGPSLTQNTNRRYIGIESGPGAGLLAKVTAINSATSVTVVDADTGLPLSPAPDATSTYRSYQMYRDVADYSVETDCYWRTVPFSVCAKLCVELGCDAWVNLGAGWSDALIAECVSEFAANMPTGKFYPEPHNETWNFATAFVAANRYLCHFYQARIDAVGTTGSPAAKGSADAGACSTLDLSLKFAKAFEDVVGASRVVRMMPRWWGSSGGGAGAFEYLDPGYFATGEKAIDQVAALAYAPYFSPRAVGPYSVDRKTVLRDKQYAAPAYWAAVFRAAVGYWSSFGDGVETQRAARAPHTYLIGYEGGADATLAGATSCVGAINSGDNTLLISDGTDMTLYCDNGDTVLVSESGGGSLALFTGQNNFTPYYVKVVSSSKIRFFSTLANYNSDTAATLNGSQPSYTIDAYSRDLACNAALNSFLESTEMGTLYAEYYERQYRQRRFRLINQYFSCGGTSEFPWGLTRSQYIADSPRMTYWKTLP